MLLVFGLTRPGIETMIYSIPGTNHDTTEVIN